MSSKKEKLTLSQVRKLPYKTLNRLINKAKKVIEHDEVWKKICKEYDEDPDIIHLIPTMFGNLEVSAKTNHGIIILNYKLLCDGDFVNNYSYLVHEGTHWLQRTTGNKPTQSADDGDYLHNPHEQEGFAYQVEYIANTEGKNEAEEYVEDLLEHHDKDGKEKHELKDILLNKIEV